MPSWQLVFGERSGGVLCRALDGSAGEGCMVWGNGCFCSGSVECRGCIDCLNISGGHITNKSMGNMLPSCIVPSGVVVGVAGYGGDVRSQYLTDESKVIVKFIMVVDGGMLVSFGQIFAELALLSHPVDQVLNVLRPNLLFDNNNNMFDVMYDICQRAKHTREPFPLSDHISTEIGLNNLNFFDLEYLNDHSDIPNDKERSDLSPNRYGIPSPHSGSTFKPLNENEGGHFHGPNVVASEEERFANHKENQNIIFEGHGPLFSSQNDQDIFEPQNLINFKPKSFKEAAKHHPWVDAMNSEMDALYRNNTWDLVDLPQGRKAIVEQWKCLINLVVQNGWTLYQMDVNNAFLYGDLNETMYRTLPPGYFPKNETRVCKLNKSLYGLKQATKQWNAKLTSALVKCGFVQSKSDYSLFTKKFGDVFIILLVYVDDIIITGNNLHETNKFKQFLKTKFMIKDLGKLKYILGIEILETATCVCLNQRIYYLELIGEFGLLASKPSYIPMQPNISLSSETKDDDPLLENVTDYQKLIGKLTYLTTKRPDIGVPT
ncbi:ribonuclease H-like domain-containing protein [Tanacetum coccineum]